MKKGDFSKACNEEVIKKNGLEPVLTIIHTSDWHIGAVSKPDSALNFRINLLNKILVPLLPIIFSNDYEEKLRTHDEAAWLSALESFKIIIDEAKCPVWFVDTGDATTFGEHTLLDDHRVKLAEVKKIEKLNNCRSIFGNHDVWPGTLPALNGIPPILGSKLGVVKNREQRDFIGQFPEWDKQRWLDEPLLKEVDCGNYNVTIRLFGIDSTSDKVSHPSRAIGCVENEFKQLQEAQKSMTGQLHQYSFDIVCMHHALHCPEVIETKKCGLVDTVKVRNDSERQKEFASKGLGRLALCGHIHHLLPHHGNMEQVTKEGNIGKHNLQCSVGALMLPNEEVRRPCGINTSQQQYQVLTLYKSKNDKGKKGLYLGRVLVNRLREAADSTQGYGFARVGEDENGVEKWRANGPMNEITFLPIF